MAEKKVSYEDGWGNIIYEYSILLVFLGILIRIIYLASKMTGG